MLRAVALGLMCIAVLGPFVPLLLWSFAFRWAFPDVLPAEWSLRAWRYIAAPESQVLPALVVAYQIYGSIDSAPDIVTRNRVRHPGFVPAAALEVLVK